MFLTKLNAAADWFEVLQSTNRSQTAVMNLAPGQSNGAKSEGHPDSDQVLLVLEGEVTVHVGEEKARMRTGDVVIIPAGIRHRFHNETTSIVRTFSVYAPPGYPRRRGRTATSNVERPASNVQLVSR